MDIFPVSQSSMRNHSPIILELAICQTYHVSDILTVQDKINRNKFLYKLAASLFQCCPKFWASFPAFACYVIGMFGTSLLQVFKTCYKDQTSFVKNLCKSCSKESKQIRCFWQGKPTFVKILGKSFMEIYCHV